MRGSGGLLKCQHGVALVVVLWLVALLALMAVSQNAAVRTDTLVVGNLVESASARATANAGLQLAIFDLSKPLSARELTGDGSVNNLQFGTAKLFIAITDESGKVDINAAPASLLGKFLAASGVEQEQRKALVDAILDWRDRDTLRRLNGAENKEYRDAGLGYGPRNGPFQSREELALVMGVDAELYHTLAKHLTLYTGSRSINMQAASPELRQALSDWNDNWENDEYTPVDDEFENSSVNPGTVFTIAVEALLKSGVRENLEAVVRLHPSRANAPLRYEFLRWRERGTGSCFSCIELDEKASGS